MRAVADIVEAIKRGGDGGVPIWKRERYADGSCSWKEN